MQGTVHRNFLHRLGDAWQAYKALPSPAQLYPTQYSQQPGYISWPGWSAFEARGQQNSIDEQRVKKAVQSPSVFANMRAIATEFAGSEIVVKERQGERLEDVDNHPLEVLWKAPNPDLSRFHTMEFWAWSYTMVGKAYLYWLPAGGQIREVWPIPPFMITPIPDSKEFVGGFAFKARPDAQPIMIPREYITYSHSVNIFDARDSLSFLVAGMTPVESEIAMGFWNRNFFEEGNGIPDGLITVPKDTLDSDLSRIRQEIREFFGGTRRGVAVARSGDLDYKPFGRSQKDAEFIEGIKLASTQIGRLMGFPDGYWSESANRANAEQARATMIAGAVWPLLVRLAEDMNAGVVRRWWGEQYRAEFKDIRPEDRALKLQELQFYSTIETVNELRERIGDDPLDDPRGEMLLAEINKGSPLPATPASEETEDYLTEQEAANAPPEEEGVPPEGGDVLTEEAPVEEVPVPEEAAKTIPLSRAMRDDWRADDTTAALDMERWERKALKSLRRFHTAAVKFESLSIPLPEQEAIRAALAEATTPEAVKAAFAKTDLGRELWSRRGEYIASGGEIKAARRLTVDQLAGDAAVLERAKKLRGEIKDR